MMKKHNLALLGAACLFTAFSVYGCGKKSTGGDSGTTPVTPVTPVKTDVRMYLTTADRSQLLAKQNVSLLFGTSTNQNTTITVDSTQQYQTIDGFGFALTGGSATLLNQSSQSDALIHELFATDSASIGVSYLRISMGASDMSATDFTYDDISSGTDINLDHFSIDAEKTDLIPVLKKILAINPNIKIIATPWTAPVWMKINTIGNQGFTGGSLDHQYYDVYARYFVKYIQAMKAQGITIDAIAPQNEPLNANNNPAMVMQASEEDDFIKNYLGPQFKTAGISTKIIVYDHNADNTQYALSILGDAAASQYVDGSAFHLYNGSISALAGVHNAYPNKNLYFTEQYTPSTGAFNGDLSWHINNLIVGATRNWCRNVLEWNLATDANFGPHTAGGCSTCQGALTIGSFVSRNVSYYIIAHASKFVRPGAVRIASDDLTTLPNVAFKNTDGSKVLIVLNNTSATQTFNIKYKSKTVSTTIDAGAVATYKW